VTDIGQQRTWLRLLEEEHGRRVKRTEWEKGESERAREAFAAELRQIAQRLGTMADKYPLDLAEMSPIEMLAVNIFWPKPMHPPGLPSMTRILAPFRARARARGGER
jgi:hypothetical protein